MAVARGRNRGLSGTDLMECTDVCSLFFFFSSRRRHTRCGREWSSDVCSSDLLFTLETQSLSQDAAAAKANVNAAQVEVNKLKPLVEKNIISNVQLETAKAKLLQAQSGYNSIAATIGYATIKSPVDGYVGAIPFREGSLVSPTSPTPLTTVADVDKIYAFFSMNEKDFLDFIQNSEGKTLQDKIKNLPKVRLILANGNLYDQEGIIETINPQVNAATGTVSFRAVFKIGRAHV